MNKDVIFIYSSILYIFGIFINNLSGDLVTSLLVLLFLVVLFLSFIIYRPKYYLITISLVTFLFGTLISQNYIKNVKNNLDYISNYSLSENITIKTQILDIRKINDDSITYTSKLLEINNNIVNKKIKHETTIKSNYKLKKGTIITTKTKLYLYKNNPSFKYKNYMLSNSLYFKIYPYYYSIQGFYEISSLEAKIIAFKDNLLNTITEIYTNDEGLFLGGILLGARESLSDNLKQDFNKSGLTHFIAVSGFNITILVIFLGYFIKALPFYIKIILMSIFIILFTILVGFTAPVVRASITGILGYIIVSSGKKSNNLSIILLALIIMISINPYSLNYDISLHLSFLAVIGILYCHNFFEKIFSFVTDFLEIRTAFTLTLSAMVFTLPIMLFNFGQLSIISPISNILVSWTIPFAMVFGFLSIILYHLSPILGISIGYIAWILLKWDILIVNLFGGFKYSIISHDFGQYRGYYEIIYLIIVTFIILYFRQEKKDSV